MANKDVLNIKKEPKDNYSFPASKIGATTSPQVANQIGEFNSRLNQGLRDVELGTMNQRLLDQVPKEHFTEIRRMAKLTGAEPSLHAPIQDLDLAGFTQQGWDPNERENKVRQLNSVIEKAHLLDPEGNTPITIHAGSAPTQKWQREGLKEMDEYGDIREVKGGGRSEMALVNPHTGEVNNTRYRERMMVGKDKTIPFTPEDQMRARNKSQWDDEQFKLLQWKKMMHERDQMTGHRLDSGGYSDLMQEKKEGILSDEGKDKLKELDLELRDNIAFKNETYHNMRMAVEDMYERFEKYPYEGEDTTEALRYQDYKKNEYPKFKQELKEGEKELENREREFRELLKKGASEEDKTVARQRYEEANQRQTENIIRSFQEMPAPRTWQPVDEFAMKETSTSLAEAAVESFKKYGKKSPMLLLENVYPEFTLSRAEDLKNTIELAQEKLVKKLTDKALMDGKELSTSEAKKRASEIIGATWDVGHIYMLKKSGYKDKDIVEEAKKIASHVKHIHLTDNFGFEDSHLPPGMGDVNIKDQLRAIEKVNADMGNADDFKKVRGIVEAGEFVANYKEVPHLHALDHLSSPLYADQAAPHWGDIQDNFGVYGGGYGELLPQKYFDLYGAPGFSQLPATLGGGGSSGGERGRFASAMTGDDEE
jgi:sugar phosphate isomerase/epimerase